MAVNRVPQDYSPWRTHVVNQESADSELQKAFGQLLKSVRKKEGFPKRVLQNSAP